MELVNKLDTKSVKIDKKNINILDVPSFIFKDRSLSVLEAMVEYLKDVKKFSYHEIALMLNRDDRTMWTVYSRVKEKRISRKK